MFLIGQAVGGDATLTGTQTVRWFVGWPEVRGGGEGRNRSRGVPANPGLVRPDSKSRSLSRQNSRRRPSVIDRGFRSSTA